MKRIWFLLAVSIGTISSVCAQGLVAYYQIGGDKVPWVSWDTYVVDSESIVIDGEFINYKSLRISASGSDEHQLIRADCKTMKRGRVADIAMYSTYDGTLSGQEVKAACKIAIAKGLLNR